MCIRDRQMEGCVATATNETGNYEKALEQFQIILPKIQRILGIEHQITLKTANDMTITLIRLERYIEALEIYSEIIEVRNKKYGEDHKETIATKQNIAVVLDKQGKHSEAMELYQEVLE